MTPNMHNLKYNREFFKDFWELCKPYWRSEERWSAYGLLALVLFCNVVQIAGSVALNSFYQEFFDALQNFSKHVMWALLGQFTVIVIALILSVGYGLYLSGILSIRWRRWLTKNFVANWLARDTFYRMQILHKNVDNPDQRISEDLDSFAASTLSLATTIFNSLLTIIVFGVILWRISGNIHIPITSTYQLTISGYLLWVALICAVVGTWLTRVIGRSLAGLDYQQQQFNANFRFGLVRVRETSEQIALYNGETLENNHLNDIFKSIFSNFLSLIKIQKYLMFFRFGYTSVSYFIGLIAGLPLYFSKKIQIGGIMQISGAYGEVIGALSILVTAFASIAAWRAVIYRLTEFNHHMDEAHNLPANAQIQHNFHSENTVVVSNLTLLSPLNQLLAQNLNFSIHSGDSLLITGTTGAGKSTLLRALAGIWPYGHGDIKLPQTKMMFLPQKPYLPLGSLREVLIYPDSSNTINNQELINVLKLCHLEKLQNDLDKVSNWSHELSLGEQQLIGFARIFLQKPDWVFLDEATSALDEKTEQQMYQILREQISNIAVISVGHRSSLNSFHKQKLEISKIPNPPMPPEPEVSISNALL